VSAPSGYPISSLWAWQTWAVEPAEVDDHPAPRPVGRMERKKAETRRRIIDAASQLFWTKGYDATSIHDIADRVDMAPGTFYLHFESKADVALIQFRQWMADFTEAIESRPAGETPDQMLAAALHQLSDAGYTSSQQLRDDGGRPLPSVIMGILFTESALEISGRVYQIMIETEQALAALFAGRLDYPVGSLEPQIIASAFIAAWRVAVYGFANLVAAGIDPPSPDELGLRTFTAYAQGLEALWTQQPTPPRPA
jgi:AcrR family transcriptional regulator